MSSQVKQNKNFLCELKLCTKRYVAVDMSMLHATFGGSGWMMTTAGPELSTYRSARSSLGRRI